MSVMILVACRTGVIFFVFRAKRGESEAKARRKRGEREPRVACEGSRTKNSRASRADSCIALAPLIRLFCRLWLWIQKCKLNNVELSSKCSILNLRNWKQKGLRRKKRELEKWQSEIFPEYRRILKTLILRPFQLQQKKCTNCGYKHDETTHVVKLWLMT